MSKISNEGQLWAAIAFEIEAQILASSEVQEPDFTENDAERFGRLAMHNIKKVLIENGFKIVKQDE